MSKPNALVKISGDLLQHAEVIAWLKVLLQTYSLTILTGGGTQINEEFKKRGWPVKPHGPFGRELTDLKQKQAARAVLEDNQADIQDFLDTHGVSAGLAIPTKYMGTVLCHGNADFEALMYGCNSFHKVFMITLKERIKEKELFLERVAIFLEKGPLKNVEVIGF